MRMTVKQLRKVIENALEGSHPDESYSEELYDDEALHKQSVLVPDTAKKKIFAWMKDMGLRR